MPQEYFISYTAENVYENEVVEAFWQFLILPEENESQKIVEWSFDNSLKTKNHLSKNGLGFNVLKIRPDRAFKKIKFRLTCTLIKEESNPYGFLPNSDVQKDYEELNRLDFKIQNEPYLRDTIFTKLPKQHEDLFVFDESKTIFENLLKLNNWTYIHLFFKVGVTNVDTSLQEIIDKRHGVCQDFTHLFCAIAKQNNVPTRYVSGYVHQGNDYFGDSQMHAWAEAFVPEAGWIGFDPTNNILAADNHVKVAHGKDYSDCSPLKGVVFSSGTNETNYSVIVQSRQAQQ